ncbi:MAG: glycosyltransferase 87 family protein [Chloroflexota bacterium]
MRTTAVYALALALLAALLAADLVRVWGLTNHHDLDVFLLAARRLASGEDIYADAAPFQAALEAGTLSLRDDTVVWPYAYPPTIALLFVPTVGWPAAAVRAGWWALNVVCLLLGTGLAVTSLPQRDVRQYVPLAALALAALYRYDPAVVALRLGQSELFQFLLLTLALYGLTRPAPCAGWEVLAGLALGLAAAAKFVPGALLVLLLWRRRWRPALWGLGSAAAALGGSFALVGWPSLARYLAYSGIYGIGGAFAAFPLNQSFNGLFSRNLVANVFSPTLAGVNLPGLARALTLAADAAVVSLSAWITWHRAPWPAQPAAAERERFASEYGLAIVALLLVSPHAQVYAYAWALIPLVRLAGDLLARPRLRRWAWVGLLGAYALIGRSYVLYRPGLTRLVQAHYLVGALLLWATLAALLWPGRPSTQPPA